MMTDMDMTAKLRGMGSLDSLEVWKSALAVLLLDSDIGYCAAVAHGVCTTFHAKDDRVWSLLLCLNQISGLLPLSAL